MSPPRRTIRHMDNRVVFTVCLSGPYRHVRGLLRQNARAWFPWGYRRRQISDKAAPLIMQGAQAELWEVDDVRTPHEAMLLAVVDIDFVSAGGDYVAMTLRGTDREPTATAEMVVRGSETGELVFTTAELERSG